MSKKSNTPIVITPDVLSQMADRLLHELKSGRPTTKLGLLNTMAASIAGPKRNHGYLKNADKPVFANGIDLDAVKEILIENLFMHTQSPKDEISASRASYDLAADYQFLIQALKLAREAVFSKNENMGRDDDFWLEFSVTMNFLHDGAHTVEPHRIERAREFLGNIPKIKDTGTPEGFDYWIQVQRAFTRLADSGHQDSEPNEYTRDQIVFFASDAFAMLFKEHHHFAEARKVDVTRDDFAEMTSRAAQKYLLEHPHPSLEDVQKYGGALVSKDIFDNPSITHIEILQEAFEVTTGRSLGPEVAAPAL